MNIEIFPIKLEIKQKVGLALLKAAPTSEDRIGQTACVEDSSRHKDMERQSTSLVFNNHQPNVYMVKMFDLMFKQLGFEPTVCSIVLRHKLGYSADWVKWLGGEWAVCVVD